MEVNVDERLGSAAEEAAPRVGSDRVAANQIRFNPLHGFHFRQFSDLDPSFHYHSPGLYQKLHGVARPVGMRKTVIKRRKRVSGVNGQSQAPGSSIAANPQDTDIDEEGASSINGSIAAPGYTIGPSQSRPPPPSQGTPGRQGFQSDHEAAMTLMAVSTGVGTGSPEQERRELQQQRNAASTGLQAPRAALPSAASSGRDKARAAAAVAAAAATTTATAKTTPAVHNGSSASTVAGVKQPAQDHAGNDERPSKRTKQGDAGPSQEASKQTGQSSSHGAPARTTSPTSTLGHHHHHHHHHPVVRAGPGSTHSHTHSTRPHAHSDVGSRNAVPQNILAEVVQSHLELLEERKRLDLLLRKTEAVLANAGVPIPSLASTATPHHHHHHPTTAAHAVPHVHHHHPTAHHVYTGHTHAIVHRVHPHAHVQHQPAAAAVTGAHQHQQQAHTQQQGQQERQQQPGKAVTDGEASEPSVNGDAKPRGLSAPPREEDGQKAAEEEADKEIGEARSTKSAPAMETGEEQEEAPVSRNDFEARLAAMPITAAVPLPGRKLAEGSGPRGKRNRLADRDDGNDSEASSAISGWLKGVADSNSEGGPVRHGHDEAEQPAKDGTVEAAEARDQ